MSDNKNVISFEQRLAARLLAARLRERDYFDKMNARSEAFGVLGVAVKQMRDLGLTSKDIAALFTFSADEISGDEE
jgi:hypothetical protein